MNRPLNPGNPVQNTSNSALPFSSEELQQHIDQDLSMCSQLLELLREEQEALKARDVDKVEELLERKVPILEALEHNAKQRQAWASASLAGENTEALWASLLSSLGNTGIKQRWSQLKSLYADVRTQNEVNGKLLSRHQGTLQRLLDIMRGKTASPNLYNATGYSSASSQSNNFGEA